MKSFLLISLITFFVSYTNSQTHKILASTEKSIIIEFDFSNAYEFGDYDIKGKSFLKITGAGYNFREPGQPWLPEYVINVGVPLNSTPSLSIKKSDQTIRNNIHVLPYPKEDPQFTTPDLEDIDKNIYLKNGNFPNFVSEFGDEFIFRYSRIIPVKVSPFQYNPVTRELIVNIKVIVEVSYNQTSQNNFVRASDAFTRDYLTSTVVNPKEAQNWMAAVLPEPESVDSYWYNPGRDYFKIYLKEKGVYRLTYDYLVNSGVPLGAGTVSTKLEMFNEGNPVSLDIHDGGDFTFGPGDYLQFVGGPPTPTPNTKINIYNNSNVYWLSYQSDSSGLSFNDVNGFPSTWDKTYQSVPKLLHFEKDSIYERLGYAGNDQRDFWFWGKATSQNYQIGTYFQSGFDNTVIEANFDSALTLRVDMHGMTNNPYCNFEHTAYIEITEQLIGTLNWDGQNRALFEKQFYVGEDSIHIYPEGNFVKVYVLGDSCTTGTDDIRINWFELEYQKWNKVNGNNFIFTAPANYSGVNRFWLWEWQRDNMTIYIPSKNKKITNPNILGDDFKSAMFVDSVTQSTEYFCVSNDYYLVPDSITRDVVSDIRNTANGSDYIIITHRKFTSVAEGLKTFREGYFPDSTIPNPRINIVYIDNIYDEFSYGLLDPFAVQMFLKHAFDNWQSPAPVYVVLMGDMSYDYRHIQSSSRDNYIPSAPYYTHTYGLAASDNIFAAVSGNDIIPEMALSRFSIETVEEGNIYLDKLVNYPSDNSKSWKQNVLLVSSGLNADDENYFGFNNASVKLENLYLKPNGFKATKIMRFPNQPQYVQYQGDGPEIRAAINEGTVFLNYYGHGGGYQWDLVFTNDDIYLLENGGRLPFVSSVTCYTAHFDNQDVFGEQFIKVPGKGAIAFFGSSGLTLWGIGTYINEVLFEEIFTKREYISGRAILNAKSLVGSSSFYNSQIALLTLLGEPLLKLCLPDKPDFTVTSKDIVLSPENPIADDTVTVKINLYNLGVVFPNDSVSVELTAASPDTTYTIAQLKRGSFGEGDSLTVPWVPSYGGLYNFNLNVNLIDQIPEMDYSDNSITVSSVIYDLSEPNIITPIDGYTSSGKIDFLFSDIGHYLGLNLEYQIEIDTSLNFNSPILTTTVSPVDAELRWISPDLNTGIYFWRTRVFDGVNYGGWSKPRAFTVAPIAINGYNASGQIFKMFNTYNVNYIPEDGTLTLNTDQLPPKPSNNRFVNDISVDAAALDSIDLTTITSDGKYIYVANVRYFSLDSNNTDGASKIYKIGTGFNGTIEGEYYGTIPDFFNPIQNQIFYHSDGFIYIAQGNPYSLKRVHPETGDTATVSIPPGILSADNSRIEAGPQYITSDGNYVYNLALFDTTGYNRYILRILDPANGWALVRPDMALSGTSFNPGFTGFFVSDNYLFPSEYYWHNEMRRISIEDGVYEEEWISFIPFQSYYAWHYDWINNLVYSTVFRQSGFEPKISKFQGTYIDAQGNINSSIIGPASQWNSVSYNIENLSPNSEFKVNLLGQNQLTKAYDTLMIEIPELQSLESVSPSKYPYLKLDITFIDSSLGAPMPTKLKQVVLDYLTPPEVIFTKNNFTITPDSVLQGFEVKFDFAAKNIGKVSADSLTIDFFMDDEDSSFYSQTISLMPESIVPVASQTISTFSTSPATLHNIKAVGVLNEAEYFTFNNILRSGFYVARDSIKPDYMIMVDGKEIINGDIVSSTPDILITLTDEGPLPLDVSLFTVIYNNIPLNLERPDVTVTESGYPNNEVKINWKPELPNGRHVIEVLAKDQSGNFFDSVAHKTIFYVYNEFNLVNVYNYPNPFATDTYFTFQLHGDNNKLEDFRIKIYSVAGRLLKEFEVPLTDLRSGFNKLYWDGRDQDGDEIANGVYFYKVITKSDGEVKTEIKKLAKVK